jgi:pimeloyl-ACP methyl ester carboxylesterase
MTMATQTTSSVRSKDGTEIVLDRVGEGPALVLVEAAMQTRGGPGITQLAEQLADRFTVYSYDRRGRGDSGDTPPYAKEREIEDVEAVVAEAGGSAFAVGGSSGGVLALDAAASGAAVTKVALYEPPFIVDDSRPPVPGDYVPQLEARIADGRPGDAVEYFLTRAIGMPAEMVGGMRQSPMWPDMEAVAHTISYDGRFMEGTMSGGPLPADRWAPVAAPVLVVDGGASPPWLHNAADALASVLPSATRRTLEGQTHAVDTEILAPVLIEFFAG